MCKNKKYFYGFWTIKNLVNYKFNYIEKIFCINSNKRKYIDLLNLIKIKNIPYEIVNRNYFNRFSKFNHQGILALIKKKKMFCSNINDLLNIIKKKKKHFFLILDSIDNPNNLGSCIRTAVAANIDSIIITNYNTVSIDNNIVHKVSMGSLYKIFILVVNNINNVINLLNKYNFLLLSTDLNSKNSIYKFNFNNYNSIAVILGSENKGVKKKIKEKCNFLFRIPIKNINSLNVAVSSGIIIFEILRQINGL